MGPPQIIGGAILILKMWHSISFSLSFVQYLCHVCPVSFIVSNLIFTVAVLGLIQIILYVLYSVETIFLFGDSIQGPKGRHQ